MKKIIVFLLTMVMVFTLLAGCGGGGGESESSEIPDLTGNWVQEDADFDAMFLAGYIEGDVIELFWVDNSEEINSLYWSGTYVAPDSSTDSFSWDSENDTSRTSSALLASSDETKTFTYEAGKISFEASALGVTSTVTIIPTDTAYYSDSASGQSSTAEYKEVECSDANYTVLNAEDGTCTILYSLRLTNPNEDYAVMLPTITITLKNAEGGIIAVEEAVLMGLAAGDSFMYGNYIYCDGGTPATIEFSAGNDASEYYYIEQEGSEYIYAADLSVSNVSEIPGSYGMKSFTGEVTNNSTQTVNPTIVVLYKKGDAYVGGENSYASEVAPGETIPFEVTSFHEFTDYDSFEIIAIPN